PLLTVSFYITPPTPTSTLFPYTTLFRSRYDTGCTYGPLRARAQTARSVHGPIETRDLQNSVRAPKEVSRRPTASRSRAGGLATPDRKSTRLNSSYQIISYAVFCLKKKKK